MISRISRGDNLGPTVRHSGTLGAAREAALAGLRSRAVSILGNDEHDYAAAAACIRQLVEQLRAKQLLKPELFLNVLGGNPAAALDDLGYAVGMPQREEPVRIAHAFVEAINHQSVEEIAKLMSEDHLFVDSGGMRMQGKEEMRAGWLGYFRMVPDYTITIEETLAKGPVVVMLGTAQGTYTADGRLHPKNRWQTPAAWKAMIRGALVSEWRVYADNEPIRLVMARCRSPI